MEAKHYSFKLIRPQQSVLILGLTFILFFSVVHLTAVWISEIWSDIKAWGFIFYFIAFVLALFVGKLLNKIVTRFSFGEVDFCIQDDTITLKWIRPIRFRHCGDLTFQWKDIQSYSFSQVNITSGSPVTLPFFKIILNKGSRISFDPMEVKDKMFTHFVTAMQQGIEQYNSLHQAHPVKPWQSIYGRRLGLLISAGLLLSFAALPFFLTHIPAASKLFWIPAGIYYLTTGLFIFGTVFTRIVYKGEK